MFVIVMVASLAGDLLSKHWVFRSILSDSQTVQIVNRVLDESVGTSPSTRGVLLRIPSRGALPGVKFTLSTNPGVVFGLPMPRWAVAIATGLTIVLVCFFFATSDSRAWSMHTALALVLAGALGNLYDRLFSEVALPLGNLEPIRYEVRDFIDCGDLYYPWIFNVADILLVVGAGILVIHWFALSSKSGKEHC